jgi:hypothetical protein
MRTAMTLEQGAGQVDTVVSIRSTRYALIQPFVTAGLFLGIAGLIWTRGDQMGSSPFWLALSGVIVAQSLWELTWGGVDLTPDSAVVRGVRWRRIPWREVQAVVPHERNGSRMVRLIPMNSKPVTLRAPTSWWRLGGAAYERDFHRIYQWRLAHRGESWRPVPQEEPRPPVQG